MNAETGTTDRLETACLTPEDGKMLTARADNTDTSDKTPEMTVAGTSDSVNKTLAEEPGSTVPGLRGMGGNGRNAFGAGCTNYPEALPDEDLQQMGDQMRVKPLNELPPPPPMPDGDMYDDLQPYLSW